MSLLTLTIVSPYMLTLNKVSYVEVSLHEFGVPGAEPSHSQVHQTRKLTGRTVPACGTL